MDAEHVEQAYLRAEGGGAREDCCAPESSALNNRASSVLPVSLLMDAPIPALLALVWSAQWAHLKMSGR